MPPELTPLGRAFKLNGYTMAGKPTVTSPGKGNTGALNILESFPLSVLFDTSFTSLKSPEPAAQNGSFQFPQQASLFLAGAWATHVGSFVQVTYTSQGDHFTWDNSDIRYANATKLFKKDLAFGITLNNNPTVEDLWNSTPAWGFPWVGSDWAPTPTAGAIVNGGLAEDVAGIGVYAMWDNHLYFAGTVYRSAHIGAPQPNTGVDGSGAPLTFNIRGVAPYWRVAWQQNSKNNNLMVGTYGIHMKSTPGAITGLEDGYTDWAVDFQDDLTIPKFRGDVLSIRGTYIRENSSLVATASSTQRSSFSSITSIPSRRTRSITSATSTRPPSDISMLTELPILCSFLQATQVPVTGSANGDPRSDGYIANISWWPVQNIGLTFQYTGIRVSMGPPRTTMVRDEMPVQTTRSIYSRDSFSRIFRKRSPVPHF